MSTPQVLARFNRSDFMDLRCMDARANSTADQQIHKTKDDTKIKVLD